MGGPGNVTKLLREWESGSQEALNNLMAVVYEELRALARRHMRNESPGHTLRATAMVNEVYLRLVGSDAIFADRVHFFAVSARMLRRILVDHARASRRDKRGGDAVHFSLDESLDSVCSPEQFLELNLALDRLSSFDERKATLIEYLFFGGMTRDEAAAALHISPATVDREVKMGKAWLQKELRASADAP